MDAIPGSSSALEALPATVEAERRERLARRIEEDARWREGVGATICEALGGLP